MATLGLIYTSTLAEILRFLINLTAQVEADLAAIERARELLDAPHEAAHELTTDKECVVHSESSGISMTFEKVILRYRPHLEPSLHGISFQVNAGERIGIVGRSGSGKSTLFVAILRLVEPCSGRILMGGIDASKMGLHLLRSTITVIPQDPVMFAGSLRWNIDPTCSYGNKDVESACDSSGVLEMRTPFSLTEEVKEYGQNFSVGERQLVCMARALLRRNPVMLFDEATASMDVESDARLQSVLRKDCKGATILTVAHRVGTIIDYDRILSLSSGKVAELDTPTNLFANSGGIFASLAHEAGISPQAQIASI